MRERTRLASADAVLPKPRSVLLVHGFNVVQESVVQVAEQGAQFDAFAVLQAMRRLQNIGQDAMVLGAMFRKAGLFAIRMEK